MTDTLTLEDWYGKDAPVEELESVVIVPLGNNTSGTFTYADGEWTDFEYIELFGSATNTGLNNRTQAYSAIDKLQIAADPTGWFMQARTEAGNLSQVQATGVNTLAVSADSNDSVQLVVGHKKRFATKNVSRTVSVNGGNNIAVNSRYEVQLPPEFYDESGRVKEGVSVKAEIFNNSGTGIADWGETGSFTQGATNDSSFAIATIVGSIVAVQAGNDQLSSQSVLCGNGFGNTSAIVSAPCRVIATLNDAYMVNIEGPQSEFERIINAEVDVLQFTASGQFAYIPLSDSDFDGEIFEYNSTTRFLRVKKTGIYSPFLFSHAEDGAGTAQIKYTLIEADTANGDNPVPKTGTFTKQYDSDGGTLSIHLPLELDESKWYAVYAENYSNGNVTYTTASNVTSDPNLANTTDFAFTFTLEQH